MKVQNMVPEVYYKESRDFSYIGRLCEILFNYLKTNADIVNSNLINIDSDDLLNSLAYTLGFKPKHIYNNKDLLNICSSFVHIMKNKGTLYAIEECIKILLNSQHLEGTPICIPDNNNYIVTIGLPPGTQDIILLEDLLDYILPTGWIYRITTMGVINNLAIDKYEYTDKNTKYKKVSSQNISQVARIVKLDFDANRFEYNDETNTYSDDNNISDNKSQLYSSVVYQPKSLDTEEEGD